MPALAILVEQAPGISLVAVAGAPAADLALAQATLLELDPAEVAPVEVTNPAQVLGDSDDSGSGDQSGGSGGY